MQTTAIVMLLTLFAVAVVPLMIGYYLWLDRMVVPKLLGLPAPVARTVLAGCIALPWIVAALIVWLIQRWPLTSG